MINRGTPSRLVRGADTAARRKVGGGSLR